MKKILIIFLFLILVTNIFASNKYSGNTAAAFLKINPVARAVGLGNTYVSIGEGANSTYYNPALITGIKRIDISVSYSKWFQALNYGSVFGGISLNRAGVLDFGVTGLFYDKINVTTDDGNGNILISDETVSAGDFCIYGAYANKIGKFISLGINFKGIMQRLDIERTFKFACDLGFAFRPENNKWGLGFSAQNIGMKQKFLKNSFLLPINFRFGGHYNIIFAQKNIILIGMEIQKPIDEIIIGNIGLEYSFNEIFAIRAGYQLFGDASGIKFGASAGYKYIFAEYAFNYFKNLGTTHLIELHFKYGRERKKSEKVSNKENISKETDTNNNEI